MFARCYVEAEVRLADRFGRHLKEGNSANVIGSRQRFRNDNQVSDVASWPIVLQKSKVAGLKLLRENTKQRAIADSYDLNRVTEVACEFCVRP